MNIEEREAIEELRKLRERVEILEQYLLYLRPGDNLTVKEFLAIVNKQRAKASESE